MAPPLLTLDNLSLTFGGAPLLSGAGLIVRPRDRVALVGRNGSGKSTLLKIAAGLVEPDAGERFVDPGAKPGYLPQEPDLGGHETIISYIEAGLDPLGDPSAPAAISEELGLDPGAAPEKLSGGEARRAAIARLLVGAPDIILLDEPTNHLDLPTITWLEAKLQSSSSAVVVISHDRRFLENVTTRTVWIDRGQTRNLDRGFAHFEAWRDKVLEEEERDHHKLGRKIAAEEDWVRYGVTARRKRNVRRMRELDALRQQKRDAIKPQQTVKFQTAYAAPPGKRAIVAEKIVKRFGEKAIVEDFSLVVARGEKIGIVGPNGAGKTTLVNLLTNRLEPDDGAVELGANLEIVSLDQKRAALHNDLRVADAITDGRGDWVTIGETKKHVSTYLKDFLFSAEQWRAPVAALSGGERGRLALAAALAKPSNMLVLDEPTNDLDLETLELLEEMLAEYDGALLLVSHDRNFINRTVTSILTTDPVSPGKWRLYPGGYDDMVAQRGAAPGAAVTRPPPGKTDAENKNPPSPRKSDEPTKLSYKDKFALEQLPTEMAALEDTIKKARDTLSDPALFETDPDAFHKTAAAMEAAQTRLAAAEEEWLALEMKREAMEERAKS